MSKREFLKKMELNLVDMTDAERKKFLNYYEEIIDDYLENGMSESDAIEKIGDPKKIATKLLEEMGNGQFCSSKSVKDRWLIIITFPVWATLYFAFCTLLICIQLSLVAIECGLMIVGVVSIFCSPLVMSSYNMPVGIVQLGMGVICIGLAIVLYPLLSWGCLKVKICFLRTTNKLKKFL